MAKHELPDQSGKTSLTRNSRLRELAANPAEKIATAIDTYAPRITPDHISQAGVLVVGVGALLGVRAKTRNQRFVAAAVKGIGNGLDALDGALYRVKKRNDEALNGPSDETKTNHGGVVDFTYDRISEAISAAEQAATAAKQGRKKGVALALSAGLTHPLTSWARAGAEEVGKPVPESGRAGFFGTRTGRAIIGSVSTLYPELQEPLDAFSTASNVWTTGQRDLIRTDPTKDVVLDDKTRREAAERKGIGKELMKKTALFEVGAAAVTLLVMHKRNKKAA